MTQRISKLSIRMTAAAVADEASPRPAAGWISMCRFWLPEVKALEREAAKAVVHYWLGVLGGAIFGIILAGALLG